MSKFDISLDKVLFEKEVDVKGSNSNLIVKVVSYNEGEPKLQLSRLNFSEEWTEPRFAKLGRMSFNELQTVLPIVMIAMEKMVQKETKD